MYGYVGRIRPLFNKYASFYIFFLFAVTMLGDRIKWIIRYTEIMGEGEGIYHEHSNC